MVFEDDSSDDCSNLQYINSFDDDMQYQIPASIEDQDYNGLEKAPEGLCVEHRLPTECRVAFEGFETGRRFLACAQPEGQNCGFLGWVDPEWLPTMQNALLKLWEIEKEKLSEGNKNLKVQVDELTKSVKKVTEENVQLNLHMSDLKKGHENLIKRRDELKLQVADQLKALEKNKEKLKLIHDVLKE
nr:uncharacterized protein LOC109762780 [Aegilops tauschii subsp. strangulata]